MIVARRPRSPSPRASSRRARTPRRRGSAGQGCGGRGWRGPGCGDAAIRAVVNRPRASPATLWKAVEHGSRRKPWLFAGMTERMFADPADGAVDEILARSGKFEAKSTDPWTACGEDCGTSFHRLWTNPCSPQRCGPAVGARPVGGRYGVGRARRPAVARPRRLDRLLERGLASAARLLGVDLGASALELRLASPRLASACSRPRRLLGSRRAAAAVLGLAPRPPRRPRAPPRAAARRPRARRASRSSAVTSANTSTGTV